MSALPGPLLHPLASPRQYRAKHRTTLVAFLSLLSLFSFSYYLLFIACPSIQLSSPILPHVQDHDRLHDKHLHHRPSSEPLPHHRKVAHQLQPVRPPRPPITLSQTEELAALSAFIAALPHNVLPPSVDPNTPLDPQLVLDFDPRSESAKDELDRLVDQIWSRFPVMLFTKLHSSDSREVRYILDSMNLRPAPLVVEVDQREDAHVLSPLLSRLTRVPGLPLLLVGGQPVGTDAPDVKGLMDEIRRLHDNGELTRRVFEAGATVVPKKSKGKANK